MSKPQVITETPVSVYDIKEHLAEKGVQFQEETRLKAALGEADVVYWTRIQKERLAEAVHTRKRGHQKLADKYKTDQMRIDIPEAALGKVDE